MARIIDITHHVKKLAKIGWLFFETFEMVNIAINHIRKCGKNYRVVELEPIKVKRIIER